MTKKYMKLEKWSSSSVSSNVKANFLNFFLVDVNNSV